MVSEDFSPTLGRESSKVTSPSGPTSEPFSVKGFMFDFVQGFVDEPVMYLVSVIRW